MKIFQTTYQHHRFSSEIMSQAVWLHLPFCLRFSKVSGWLQLTFSLITRPAKPGKFCYAGPVGKTVKKDPSLAWKMAYIDTIYPSCIISQFIFRKGFCIVIIITYNFGLRQKEID
ncbi:MAG: hypothetical protein R3351_08160 [Nitrospirales bacterium]|nr:hypothetical protein [Nitrospirales bacterium]